MLANSDAPLLGVVIVAAISAIASVVVALITNRRTSTGNGSTIGELATDTNDRVTRMEERMARAEERLGNKES